MIHNWVLIISTHIEVKDRKNIIRCTAIEVSTNMCSRHVASTFFSVNKVPEGLGKKLIQLMKVSGSLSLEQHRESFGSMDPEIKKKILQAYEQCVNSI